MDKKTSFFFFLTYGFLLLAFTVYGIFYQKMISNFQFSTRFSDDYTLALFLSLENLIVIGIFTGILQAAVWWFTRSWHKK